MGWVRGCLPVCVVLVARAEVHPVLPINRPFDKDDHDHVPEQTKRKHTHRDKLEAELNPLVWEGEREGGVRWGGRSEREGGVRGVRWGGRRSERGGYGWAGVGMDDSSGVGSGR